MTGPNDIDQLPQLVERGTDRVRQFFDRLDGRFGEHSYVAGDEFSIADITAFVTFEFARGVRVDFDNERPNLNRWYGQIKERTASSR
jgi:glutathione S-transferase